MVLLLSSLLFILSLSFLLFFFWSFFLSDLSFFFFFSTLSPIVSLRRSSTCTHRAPSSLCHQGPYKMCFLLRSSSGTVSALPRTRPRGGGDTLGGTAAEESIHYKVAILHVTSLCSHVRCSISCDVSF